MSATPGIRMESLAYTDGFAKNRKFALKLHIQLVAKNSRLTL